MTDECPSKSGPLTFPNIIVDHTDMSGPYSVEDYAFDMADRAGLTDRAGGHGSVCRRL